VLKIDQNVPFPAHDWKNVPFGAHDPGALKMARFTIFERSLFLKAR